MDAGADGYAGVKNWSHQRPQSTPNGTSVWFGPRTEHLLRYFYWRYFVGVDVSSSMSSHVFFEFAKFSVLLGI